MSSLKSATRKRTQSHVYATSATSILRSNKVEKWNLAGKDEVCDRNRVPLSSSFFVLPCQRSLQKKFQNATSGNKMQIVSVFNLKLCLKSTNWKSGKFLDKKERQSPPIWMAKVTQQMCYNLSLANGIEISFKPTICVVNWRQFVALSGEG